MRKLVSVVMPCYNAQEWIREAIDSCLKQTYPNIEIVIVDDGSTDRSLEIIENYGPPVVAVSQKNSGANSARNKGFEISKGDYILYLDADDYILPERIERQVDCLETTGADVVFSSVKSQKYLPDGKVVFGKSSDERFYQPGDDVIFSLLTSNRLAHTLSPIFTRETVLKTSGWDLNVKCSQDRDFILSVALTGAKFVFLPGCYSVYRQYRKPGRVSDAKIKDRVDSSLLSTEKAEKKLLKEGLFEKYSSAVAAAYFRTSYIYPSGFTYSQYLKVVDKIQRIDQNFRPDFVDLNITSPAYDLAIKIFGFRNASLLYKFFKDCITRIKGVSNHESKFKAS